MKHHRLVFSLLKKFLYIDGSKVSLLNSLSIPKHKHKVQNAS